MPLQPPPPWPRWKTALAAFCMGAVAAGGQAPFEFWGLTVLALGLLFHQIIRQTHARRAAWAAWFGGAGYFCAALSWLISPFLVDAPHYAWMAPFALVLMAFGLALFWAVAAGLARKSSRPVLALVLALTAAELARGYVFTGFPWALLGHIWIDTPIAQLAAFAGPVGLTLLSCLMAGGVASHGAPARIAAIAALVAAWGFGAWQLAAPMPADTKTALRLVQPNAAQSLKWDPNEARGFFDRLITLTAAKPAPDLVIWPETALPYMLEYDPELAQIIADAAGGASVAMGRQRVSGDLGWNSLSILSPAGIETATYDKHHLVPFGEYIPFGDLAYDWFGISTFAAQTGNAYTRGAGPVVLDLGPLGKMLPLICYEAVFPQDLRAETRATWILQITNDAWFGTLTGPFQHAAQARLRAIEQGLPLVRAANTGVTAIYDARGRIRASLDFGISAYLDAPLPAPLPATIYARYGEGPALVLLGGLALLLLRRKPLQHA